MITFLVIAAAVAATIGGIIFAHVRSRKLEEERREQDRLRIERLVRVHSRPVVTPHFDPPPVMTTKPARKRVTRPATVTPIRKSSDDDSSSSTALGASILSSIDFGSSSSSDYGSSSSDSGSSSDWSGGGGDSGGGGASGSW